MCANAGIHAFRSEHPHKRHCAEKKKHTSVWLWRRKQCSAPQSDPASLSPFLSPSFIFPFHPSLGPIGHETRAAEHFLCWLQLDTQIPPRPLRHTRVLSEVRARLNFNPSVILFVWIKTLRAWTNTDLETQEIRYLNRDWREKQQHAFLWDGRRALEGKLNLYKVAAGDVEKIVLCQNTWTLNWLYFSSSFKIEKIYVLNI